MAKKLDVEEPETAEKAEEKKEEKERMIIFDFTRKILLAGIGAAALAEEEIKTFVDKLADRGEIAEKDARKLVKEVLEKREKMVREKVDEVRRKVPVTVATKSDIEELNARIAELTKKVDELKAKSV